MKSRALNFGLLMSLIFVALLAANWSADEYKSGIDWPEPAIVDPGDSARPPSDAIVLFDGKSLAAFEGGENWIIENDYAIVSKNGITSKQSFGDCQLHLEFATPAEVSGEGQGRGNSGVYFMGKYELQILDSFENKTYADGSAGAIYGQYPPLVNVTRPPGEWQFYDIVYTAPRFGAEGKLLSPVRLTVFHNGVLIQNNVELTGPTSWLERAPYRIHPEKQPLALQDHGNPVRFRNIWVRELGKPGRKEFTPPPALLDSYAGKYDSIEIVREGDQLAASLSGVRFSLFAESPTKFFAKTTDVQIEFPAGGKGKADRLIWSVGEGVNTAMRNK